MLLDQLICGGAIIKVSGEELKKKKKVVNSFFLILLDVTAYLPRGRPSSNPRYARTNVAKLVF